jgi:hydrogenase/urease accessory protein HupE
MKFFLFITLFFNLSIATACADEYRPAYLELQQTSAETYDVMWKVPARVADKRLSLHVLFPDGIKTVNPVRTSFIGNAYIERSTISRSGGLAGAEITIEGLATLSTDVLVRIHRLNGSSEVIRLSAAEASFVVTGEPTTWDVATTYLNLGIEHIWGGTDHLLFVACLILIAGTWRRILITITGFTIAHSITLTLAALELVRLPVPPIEVMIALSIVFLAREIALDRRDTLTWRYPIVVSSTFGLLHGFGFASALRDIGLPQTEIPAALLAFNVGVEVGQIEFVAATVSIVWVIRKASQQLAIERDNWLHLIERPVAYAVGGITMLWTIERVGAFWS